MKKIIIHSDGAARGNPGQAGAGAVLSDEHGKVVREVARYLGHKTNNEAEYAALLIGLEAAKELGATSVHVRCDSELMVKQLKGEYRVKHPNLKPLFAKAKDLVAGFESFRIEHVRREHNSHADELANQAIDEKITG